MLVIEGEKSEETRMDLRGSNEKLFGIYRKLIVILSLSRLWMFRCQHNLRYYCTNRPADFARVCQISPSHHSARVRLIMHHVTPPRAFPPTTKANFELESDIEEDAARRRSGELNQIITYEKRMNNLKSGARAKYEWSEVDWLNGWNTEW